MNCGQAKLWVQALADGELHGWRAWRLRRHVARCDGCAGELATAARLKTALASQRTLIDAAVASGAEETVFFWAQLRRRIQAQGKAGRVTPSGVWIFRREGRLVAAAVAVVFLLAFTLRWQTERAVALAGAASEITDIETPFSNSHAVTYISAESGATFVWIYGLPPEFEGDLEL